MTKQTELENAFDWLCEAKSPLVKNKNASTQQHMVSNITSIRRVAKMLQISFHEALILTYSGMSNGKERK